MVAIVYIPLAIVFVVGSSLIVFLLALVFSNFNLEVNLVRVLSIVLSYPIAVGLGLLGMRFFS